MYLGSNAYVCAYIEYMLDGGLPISSTPSVNFAHTTKTPRLQIRSGSNRKPSLRFRNGSRFRVLGLRLRSLGFTV